MIKLDSDDDDEPSIGENQNVTEPSVEEIIYIDGVEYVQID